ncbi:hypothetical protein ISS03_03295 [Patescibacteria group bacterium]|nr:hypothetical protein [Patescibacteria group bacterium]
MDDFKENKNSENTSRKQGFFIFLKLNAWIVVPILFGIYIGKQIDLSNEAGPWGLFWSLIISFIVSMIGLSIEARRLMK